MMQQTHRDHGSLALDEVKQLLSNAEKRLKEAASTSEASNKLFKSVDFVSNSKVDSSCRHEVLNTSFLDLN